MENSTKKYGGIIEKTFTTLGDYLEITNEHINSNCNKCTLFRGQDEDWPLLPKVSRFLTVNDFISFENKLLTHFQNEANPFLTVKPENTWEWLAIAQHHGLPTRLLDWSKNPLVALWFSLLTDKKLKETPSVVWIYKPDITDLLTMNNVIAEPFNEDHTKVFTPRQIIGRIRAQEGVFTVHKCANNHFVPLQNDEREKSKLIKLFVPFDKINIFRTQLTRLGIHYSSMFFVLVVLAKHVLFETLLEGGMS